MLLLVVVPYQMVWAAAAPYCAHEKTVTIKHLGHHEHSHQVAQPEVPDDDSTPAGTFHTDCASCHVANPGWVVELKIPASSAVTAVREYLEPCYDSCIVSGPERPQRASALFAARFGGGVVPGFMLT